MPTPDSAAPCPCGGETYGTCCEPIITQSAKAWTAEAVMRSRFTANVIGDLDHLWRTWHPRTRPQRVLPSGNQWLKLEVADVVDGQPGDVTGVVEFVATYRDNWRTKTMHERSGFEYRAGRWLYTEALPPTQ
ncbi:hypothetical protein FOJ82_04015 [Tessaracoccus rhinocerotis]|uniref:YchJ-like middle NTF2-like domain-containing protein n=1 Tax=Tessaracoccus rhinocerotis TaxID=1689449 RepID=A0A553K5R1_9ACTN|nr:YchJ family metal-binding protein [Tessaracoccus rhinocerotis]TRY20043.1 hypothetical protein FOJ82_04015 [Tessaracoccus rhinocerotis]